MSIAVSTHTIRMTMLAMLLIACTSILVHGQSDSYSRMLSTTMTRATACFAQTMVNQQRKNMAIAAGVWPAGTEPSAPAARPQTIVNQYPITATDFMPLSGPIMPDQLADSANGVDPQTRESMRKLFQQALTSFESGARKHNLANAFAFVTAIALQTRTGKQLNNTQADQLIVYFNNILGGSPAYYAYNPRQLQMLYESLIITGSVIALLEDQGKKSGNPQLHAQSAEMSRVVIKQFLGGDA